MLRAFPRSFRRHGKSLAKTKQERTAALTRTERAHAIIFLFKCQKMRNSLHGSRLSRNIPIPNLLACASNSRSQMMALWVSLRFHWRRLPSLSATLSLFPLFSSRRRPKIKTRVKLLCISLHDQKGGENSQVSREENELAASF